MAFRRVSRYSRGMDIRTEKARHGKKSYSSPTLVKYGTVAELTRGANLQVGDGFAGNPGTGSVNPSGQGRTP